MRDVAVAIVTTPDAPRFLVRRTERALARHGLVATVLASDECQAWLEGRRQSVWLLRAGASPTDTPRFPPASATGRTLLALGASFRRGALEPRWDALLRRGDLARLDAEVPLESVFVDDPHRLAFRMERGLGEACTELAGHAGTRVVRFAPLDVDGGDALRVVEVVTTLHRGGAERIVVDLVNALRARGVHVDLAVLDRPSRSVLPAPEGTIDLAAAGATRADRVARLADLASASNADVVHVHLASSAEIRALARATDVPVVVTLHNDRPGWPAETTTLDDADVALVLGCSTDVAARFADACPALARRTRVLWNGVADSVKRNTPGDAAASRRAMRIELGATEATAVLLVVANHRPQKRLERLPAIARELTARGRDVCVVVAGEAVSRDASATAVAAAVTEEARVSGVAERVRFLGSREDVGPLFAAADVVLTTSAFEGLSLAQLEAMRAGKPLVTTAVSGTPEIAAAHPGVFVVDVEADASAFADAIEEAIAPGAPRPERLAPAFTTSAVAARHATLLSRVATSAPRARRRGIVLVANNFAIGGAQSSARRLLEGLHARGVPVAAAVLQEQAAYPTAGRAALEAAGIRVLVAPRAGVTDPLVTAQAIACFVDARAPEAVVFWNVIAQHKVLVAELLLGTPVWDVSPGEMCFSSLARYFEAPRAGHPVRDARAYGRMLAGAVVKYEAERARAEEVLGVPVSVVPNGVPVAEISERARDEADRVVVGTLARINPDKKLEQLVRAVAHAVAREPPLRARLDVRIAGPVEQGAEGYAEELRALAGDLPVTFVGPQESSAFLADLDVFAMISEPSGCPNASLEAMAAGLPVIATDVGGAREQLEDGVSGVLVGRGDEHAFGDALVALAGDPARRHAMGRAAHARARERFSVDRMLADYVRVFGLR